MSNRLADLEEYVKRRALHSAGSRALPQKAPAQGAASIARIGRDGAAAGLGAGLSAKVSRWPTRSGAKAFSAQPAYAYSAISYDVPGNFWVIAQPSGMDCWATVFTMLKMWRSQQQMTIPEALATVGQRWVDLYNAVPDRGLPGADKPAFIASAGLVAEAPQNFSIEGWEDLLRRYGPIWVTTDENLDARGGIHARIITGIHGDGTPTGTRFKVVDPSGGRRYEESISAFIQKFEAEAIRGAALRIQVVHWHSDGTSEQQSLNRRSQRSAQTGGTTRVPGAHDLRALGLDINDFERPLAGEMQATPIDWCQIRHNIIRSAVEIQGAWLTSGGNLMDESNPAVRDMLIMFWRDGVGMSQAQAEATAAISAQDHPSRAFWSAAFISWCVRNAMPNPPPPHNGGFHFHMRHMTYVADCLRNRENNDNTRPFWLYDINDTNIVPEDGDILCLNRGGNNFSYQSIRQQWFVNNPNAEATGSSHCDIVVGRHEEGGRRWIETIGGNVGDTVGSRYYSIDNNGRLIDQVQLNGTAIRSARNVTQTVGNRHPIVYGLIRLTSCGNFQ